MPTKEEADDATTRASVRILDGLTGNGYLDFSTGMHSESTVLGEEKGSFGVRLGANLRKESESGYRLSLESSSTSLHPWDGLSNPSSLAQHPFLEEQPAVDVADTDYAHKRALVDDGHSPEVFEAHI